MTQMVTEVEYSDATFLQDINDDVFGLFSNADELLADDYLDILGPDTCANIVSELSSLQESDMSVLDSEASVVHDDLSVQSLPLISVKKNKRKPKIKLEEVDIDLSDEQNNQSSTNAKLPRLTHSSLNDVRRHYARMFTNCVNSSDLHNVDSYFNTFMSGPCAIEMNHRITSSYGLPHHIDAVGPRLFAHYLLGCFVTFPDLVLKLNDSRIVTSRAFKGTKIVMEVEAHCTKIYDIPDYQWVPGGVDELSHLYSSMDIGEGGGSGESGSASSCSGTSVANNVHHPSSTHSPSPAASHSQAVQTSSQALSTLRAPPLTAIPQCFVERVVQDARLAAVPVPLLTRGVFTLYLDENHCMQRVVIDHWQQNTSIPQRPTFG